MGSEVERWVGGEMSVESSQEVLHEVMGEGA